MPSHNPSAVGNTTSNQGRNQQSNKDKSSNQIKQSNERRESSGQGDSSLWAGHCENVGHTERIVSAGIGGLFIASGIFRGRLPGLLLTGIGASLLYRGLSGYCALYQQLGMETCEADE